VKQSGKIFTSKNIARGDFSEKRPYNGTPAMCLLFCVAYSLHSFTTERSERLLLCYHDTFMSPKGAYRAT